MKLNGRWFLSVAVIAIIGQSCSSTRMSGYSTEDELYGGSVKRTYVTDNSTEDYATPQPEATGSFEPDPSTQYEMPVSGGSDFYTDDYYGGDAPITNEEVYYDDFAYASRIRRFRRGYGTGYYDPYYTDPYWYTLDALYLTSALYSSYAWGYPTWSVGWSPWWGWSAGWSWGYAGPYWGYGGVWRPWRYGYGYGCGWGAPAYAWCPSYAGCGYGYGWGGGYGTWSGTGASGYHYGHRGGNLGGYTYNPGAGSGGAGGGTRLVSSQTTSVSNNLDSRNAVRSTHKANGINLEHGSFNNGNGSPSTNSVKSHQITGVERGHTSGLNNSTGTTGLGSTKPSTQPTKPNRSTHSGSSGWSSTGNNTSPATTMGTRNHTVKKSRGVQMKPYNPGNTGHTTRGSWSSGSTRNTVKPSTQTVKPQKQVHQSKTYRPTQKPKYNNNSYNPVKKSTSVPKVKSTPSVKPRSNFNQRVTPRKSYSAPRKTYSAPKTSSNGGGYRPSRSTPTRSVTRSSGSRSNTMRRR